MSIKRDYHQSFTFLKIFLRNNITMAIHEYNTIIEYIPPYAVVVNIFDIKSCLVLMSCIPMYPIISAMPKIMKSMYTVEYTHNQTRMGATSRWKN